MPIIIVCPSCGGKLRVADSLRGQRVRCPACNHTFDSPVEPGTPAEAPRAPQDLPLDLTFEEPTSPPQSDAGGDAGGLVGAIELQSSSEGCPVPLEPRTPPEPPRRSPPRLADERLHLEVADRRRLGPRRDLEPDRGTAVLALGIISLVSFCVAPVGIILGLAAWIMGQTDLRKMKRGQMDASGCGITQAGWICGILGTLLNGFLTLGCGLLIGSAWYSAMSSLPNTRPIPVTQPPQPPPPKNFPVPPPKNPR